MHPEAGDLTLNDIVALMREIPVFSGMDSGRLKLIACVAATTEFRGGDVVLASGSPADAVLIIASGVLLSLIHI